MDTYCVHCGQTLPHKGTGWRESSRCRLFQRIAAQAWDEGYAAGPQTDSRRNWRQSHANPYHCTGCRNVYGPHRDNCCTCCDPARKEQP